MVESHLRFLAIPMHSEPLKQPPSTPAVSQSLWYLSAIAASRKRAAPISQTTSVRAVSKCTTIIVCWAGTRRADYMWTFSKFPPVAHAASMATKRFSRQQSVVVAAITHSAAAASPTRITSMITVQRPRIFEVPTAQSNIITEEEPWTRTTKTRRRMRMMTKRTIPWAINTPMGSRGHLKSN